MAVKFFGQFLVGQGVVTSEALLHAIELQERTNLKVGEMALAMGYLTADDIERAHTAQQTKDLNFGDMLVELGILSTTQLQEVIARQKATHLYIGEALVKVGALTPAKLDACLADFKADQAPYVADRIELPAGLPNQALWETTVDMTYKMITRVLGIQFRPGKCQEVSQLGPHEMIAGMDFSGDANARYLLSVSGRLQRTIAKAVLKEDCVDHEPQEILEDAVMEFVNIVCGNVVAKASQSGTALEITPPMTIHPPENGLPVPDGYCALLFPIHVSEDDCMELGLFIKKP